MSTEQLAWFKSSYSTNEGGECIEIAITEHVVHIRDSKGRARARLTVARAEWVRFVRTAARG
ncbi:DUF397 domain-containing protein [Streptomyces sp. ET3-23]|uniref:DUF397 domain-containing protein n=1 Tax=Streptomyces sp. ET3-23 TaxID=2885643 RepID=UPI001D0FFB12|nr:DUF397 domain-containing protein [Streptomyces sp. ET3-23]MCC2276975.1 DUF397 domain-containing protein [Streptomyces sp. ET3-23]